MWVSLSVKTQAIHVIHSAQPSKYHDATFTFYKNQTDIHGNNSTHRAEPST